MTRETGPSIYIPNDKNIYDALRHKKIRHTDAISFLRSRGMIVSNLLDKVELSKKISRLTFDHHDFLYLKKLLENPNRREKTTKSTFNTSANTEKLSEVCQSISDKTTDGGESYRIIKKDDSVVLIATYTDIDFTKTELRQRSVKTCEIHLQPDTEGVSIRMPATKKGKEIARSIRKQLEEDAGKKLDESSISLENIANPEARSYFFDVLIKSIPGYKLHDVSSVNVNHEIDDLSDNSEDDKEISGSIVAGYINKAVLSGGSVLDSEEFGQLHSRDFFISRIVWTAEDTVPEGDIVELEAEFGTPSSCTEFKYQVRAIRNYNDRTSGHNITRRAPSRTETIEFSKGLEEAAENALAKVKDKYSTE